LILEAFWLVSSLKNTCMVGYREPPSGLDVLVSLVTCLMWFQVY